MKIVSVNRCVRERGFTLIELMIAVVIVATLAAIAIPSYQAHIVKTNRSDAMAVMQGFAQAMERFYAQNGTYSGAVAGTVFPDQAPIDGEARYDLSVQAADASSFRLRATPVVDSVQDGDGFMEITNTGLRSWDQNDNGSIGSGENSWSAH